MQITLFDLLVIIGISQGLFTSYLLLLSKEFKHRNRLLALVVITFILLSCKILLHTLGLWNTHTFRYFPLALDLAIQPLVYLFIYASVNPHARLRPQQLLHFIPMLVFLVHATIVYGKVLSTPVMSEKDLIADALHFNNVKSVEDFLSVLSAWIYGILSYGSIRNYSKWLNNNIADMTYPTYSWLRNVLILFGFLMLTLTINLALDSFGFGLYNFYHWQLFYLIIAVIIYYVGIQGYYSRQAAPLTVQKNESIAPANISYEAESINQVKEKILDALEKKKLYRDPEISLVKLSEKIGTSPGTTSYVINTIIGKNFRNLINDYRIDEVKAKISDPNFRHLSILGIALDCGFNSEASFYRVFKKTTGMSPKEFIDNRNDN
ncbi:helix-turn-helix transcriptional regulator [Chryseolinea sp. H1M3-3]|uniref:helix-turn-helix domain-containing protein n=1 Tax=Chryseolinea sp. H1M3-3 TaxID=3034144 RepID=UPI0023EB4D20|nr:helix-turn-helix transcriptional regulator [Chryseolinea sp. H1M3-3]